MGYKILLLFGLLNFVSQLIFILYSDIAYLATDWFVDDSYYYLQTAWNFKKYFYFTFDGLNQTYGFQPLWMLISTLISFIAPDKIIFFKSVLIFSAFLYLICGILIYQITIRIIKGKLKYLPSIIWYLNPDLVQTFNSGKENLIAIFILLLILLILFKLRNQKSKFSFIALGILCGLIILTRVNSLVLILLIIIFLFVNKNYLSSKVDILYFIIPLILVVSPWLIFAYLNYNTIFPTSGTVKLLGAQSSILIYLERIYSFGDVAWIKSILNPFEWQLYENNLAINLPSISNTFNYAFKFLPTNTFGFGFYGLIKDYISPYKYLFEILYFFLLFSPFLIVSLRIQKLSFIKEIYTSIIEKIYHSPLLILILYAIINLFVNYLLLSKWILYSTWYSFPETLCILLIVGLTIDKVGTTMRFNNKIKYLRYYTNLVLIFLILNFCIQLMPKTYKPNSSFNSQAWEAKDWMLKNIPARSLIGCFSSGILGYWMENYRVVNLDGLINSPDFVRNTLPNYILFKNNLSNTNLMLEYLNNNKIDYVADAWFDISIYSKYFMEVIPKKNYKVIYEGSHRIDWKEPRGRRIFYVIKLKY